MERYDLVTKQPDFWVVWDSTYGAYNQYQGTYPGLWGGIDDYKPEKVQWANEFESQYGFFDGREQPYLLWERKGTWGGRNDTRRYRWHIVKDGDVVCHTATCRLRPYADTLNPIRGMNAEERAEKLNSRTNRNLCEYCAKHPLPDTDQQQS